MFTLVLILIVGGEQMQITLASGLAKEACNTVLMENSQITKMGRLACVPEKINVPKNAREQSL